MRRFLAAATAAATAVALAAPRAAPAQQLAPPGTGGIAALDRALGQLTLNARVLLIAAHPDDEDTELLTFLSRGLGVEAAYLSLSRGEGGQNLIGPELGDGLGLIRTGELLAARSLDGARQFFTRAFDFGFSKSLEETARFWPPDTVLSDVLRVVRRFRPQVIVSVFSGTPRDGHGQHQLAGVVARRVFELLRDSAWGPRKLFRSARFDTAGTTVTLASGALDPVAGQSYHQIAMAGRSLHRSQDMGQLQGVGQSFTRLALVEDLTGPRRTDGGTRSRGGDAELFAGIDAALPPGLERYAALLDSARARLNPRAPDRVLPLLVAALAELRRAAPADLRWRKEPVLEEAIANAAGVVVDAAADDGRIVGGQAVTVIVSAWNTGDVPMQAGDVAIAVPRGWSVQPLGAAASPAGAAPVFGTAASSAVTTRRFSVTPPVDSPLSEPYFLSRSRHGALYDWSAAPEAVRGAPLDPPLVTASVGLTVGGAALSLEREVSHRYNDQARGEIRKPLFVVPAVGVAVDPQVLVWPVSAAGPRTITVELTHGARARTAGRVRIELPPGWPEVAAQPFALEGQDTHRSFAFEVRAPRGLRPGSYEIRAVAEAEDRRYDRATVMVDYSHIRPVAYVREAVVRVEATPLLLPRLFHVGYVRGAADQVPEALQSVGVPVTLLSADQLERGDLTVYDAIVVGSRAYEVDSALIVNNARLLDYARAGGRVIVQYQQYQFVTGNFAPFLLRIARPHDRVTDEAAPVRVLRPGSPLFHAPNQIGDSDWEGWVQERGLYFAHDWDSAYTPLLEMGDAGERLQGGLLASRLGRGVYVYTGLSFFRQLPAGVPGAYRLFANLLGLRPNDVP